jgi:beta-phosphoglucomutase-like phosphatase (HAD superfamily)
MSIEITNIEKTVKILSQHGKEIAVVKNPEYVHPEYELYPLAEKTTKPVSKLLAAVMDMDGTTTTTEELCIHSLEFMIRKMSGHKTNDQWSGLDQVKDYPYIIGNSTTKHVEFLIDKYQSQFNYDLIINEFIESVSWTVNKGKDEQRKKESLADLKHFGLKPKNSNSDLNKSLTQAKKLSKSDLVKIGINIYYARYHQILEKIRKGNGHKVSLEIFGDSSKQLISPMPGVLLFLALIKGWLDDEVIKFSKDVIENYKIKSGRIFKGDNEKVNTSLLKLSRYFKSNPCKVGVVTSSIFYEADIVMIEVFKLLSTQIDNLDLSSRKKDLLKEKFSHYNNVYDSFVTASDSSEIRLKPHRDLYSIALHQLGVGKNNFDKVIGFEDSESGTVAIRAAGIGLCIAVPFAQTSGHNLQAASFICNGGLPETILDKNIFLQID